MENYKEIEISNGQKVNVFEYLPVVQKMSFVEYVARESVNDEGVYNSIERQVAQFIGIVTFYTNLNFEDDQEKNIYDLYDVFTITGDKKLIMDNIPASELIELDGYIEDAIEEKIKLNDSLPRVIGGFLNKVVEKIPNEKFITKTLNNIPKLVNKIKPENIEIIKSALHAEMRKNE